MDAVGLLLVKYVDDWTLQYLSWSCREMTKIINCEDTWRERIEHYYGEVYTKLEHFQDLTVNEINFADASSYRAHYLTLRDLATYDSGTRKLMARIALETGHLEWFRIMRIVPTQEQVNRTCEDGHCALVEYIIDTYGIIPDDKAFNNALLSQHFEMDEILEVYCKPDLPAIMFRALMLEDSTWIETYCEQILMSPEILENRWNEINLLDWVKSIKLQDIRRTVEVAERHIRIAAHTLFTGQYLTQAQIIEHAQTGRYFIWLNVLFPFVVQATAKNYAVTKSIGPVRVFEKYRRCFQIPDDYIYLGPIFIAVKEDSVPLVQYFLQHYHYIDLVRQHQHPLLMAILQNSQEVIKFLFDNHRAPVYLQRVPVDIRPDLATHRVTEKLLLYICDYFAGIIQCINDNQSALLELLVTKANFINHPLTKLIYDDFFRACYKGIVITFLQFQELITDVINGTPNPLLAEIQALRQKTEQMSLGCLKPSIVGLNELVF